MNSPVVKSQSAANTKSLKDLSEYLLEMSLLVFELQCYPASLVASA